MKIMDKVWKRYDKSMTPLMVLMYGRLRMAFIHGELRMDNIYGHLHMVNYTWYSCRHVIAVKNRCECTHERCVRGLIKILYRWVIYMKEIMKNNRATV